MSFYSDASLVMIPSGYKTSKVYSAVPTDGAGDLSFSRSNDTATRVNSAGLIEKVRTNLILQSQNFTTTWFNSGTSGGTSTTITNNSSTAPDGTTTAALVAITRPNTSSETYISQTQTLAASGVYASSIYVKAKNSNEVGKTFRIWQYDGAIRNVKTITLTSDWQRVQTETTTSLPSGSNELLAFGFRSGQGTDLSIEFYVWGAQGETGDIATDYIPTTTAAVSVGPVANVPRLDYLNSSCPRLLLEPQRTNSQTYSEDLTQSSAWGLGATTISANATTSPDGYQNADKLVEDATTARHELYGKTLNFSGTSSVSFYAKAAGRRYFSAFVAGAPALGGATYDLQTGTITATSGGTTANIEAVSGATGWYRCSFTSTAAATTTLYICLRTTGGAPNIETYAGDGTSGIYFWGGQTELAGAYATSYIPTLGAAVTRGADAASKTGISSLIGQTEGTLFADFTLPTMANTGANLVSISLFNAGLTNATVFDIYDAGDLFAVHVNGTAQASIQKTGFTAGRHKVAFGYKANDFVLYVDGVLVGTDTSGTVGAQDSFGLQYGTSQFIGQQYVSQALVFKTRLSNADLAALTTI